MADPHATDLHKHWIWVKDFVDCSLPSECPSSGRLVQFRREIDLEHAPQKATVRCSADTRYKLFINNHRVTVGPTRGCEKIWYYDTLDVAPFLRTGRNTILFVVWRVFPSSMAAQPFERTAFPRLSALLDIEDGNDSRRICTDAEWDSVPVSGIDFPIGLKGDGMNVSSLFPSESQSFDHKQYYEKSAASSAAYFGPATKSIEYPFPRGWKQQGEIPTWRLHPRMIPQPEETGLRFIDIKRRTSTVDESAWLSTLNGKGPLELPPASYHRLEIEAECHSTAFLRFRFAGVTQARLKVTYSESYERPPLDNYDFRNKGDRRDPTNAVLTGSCIDVYDEIDLASLPVADGISTYEPFWFRTFRFLILEVWVDGDKPMVLQEVEARQTNYPLAPKAAWIQPEDGRVYEDIWQVSIRTIRNCMFDGYSDCPFYEQLQYCHDSRSSGLFHYMLSGDDRLMRQAITGFAASVTVDGLIESRYPSHTHQVITGFCLFWVLELHDHMLFFNDKRFVSRFFPIAERIFLYFDDHVDPRGLVSGFPTGYWSYVDWALEWRSTPDHPDGGVPFAGRKTNTHTIFSLLYAYVLGEAIKLAQWIDRPELCARFAKRKTSLIEAVQKHCFDGTYFTDTTVDACTGEHDHSQHAQILAVLCGAVSPEMGQRILKDAYGRGRKDAPHFVKASYCYTHYSLRAFSKAGMYEEMWDQVWQPYRKMLANNLSTWEEDDVRHRSDCHAWGSLPLYEFPVEVAGVHPIEPGCSTIAWEPRVTLSEGFDAKAALGSDNVATIKWDAKTGRASLSLTKACDIIVRKRTKNGMEETRMKNAKEASLDFPVAA